MSRPETQTAVVSVIIPCFRQGRFLSNAIESVLKQTYPSIEIVVVDDGSDDDTMSVANRFSDRVQYVRRENGGPAAARNTGLNVVKGKYLCFLDADDQIHPHAIEWLVDAAQGKEEILCVMGVRDFIHNEDLTTGREHFPPQDGSLEERLLLNNFNPPMAFLCSRQMVLNVGGFDPSAGVNACEDWDMWLRLLFAGARLIPLYQIGAYYRQHPSSHSQNKLRMARSRAEVMRRTLQYLENHPDSAASLGVEFTTVSNKLKALIAEETLAGAYYLRQQGRYVASFIQYSLSLWYGGCNSQSALLGMCKLIPHGIFHLFGWQNVSLSKQ